MTSLIAIPVRGLPGSKSRLSSLFDEDERSALVLTMLEHMLNQIPSGVDVAVISPNPEVLRSFESSVRLIAQQATYPGLNGSLQQSLLFSREAGYTDMLMLPGDLPIVGSQDVDFMLLVEGQIILAGDRNQTGTNGLRVPSYLAQSFIVGMGVNSFIHHLAEARRHELVAITVYHRGLAHDLDTPDDWNTLPMNTRERLLRRMQLAGKGA